MIYRINDEEWGGTNGWCHYVNRTNTAYRGSTNKWQDRMVKKRFVNKPTAVKCTKQPVTDEETTHSLNNRYWDEQES